MLRRLGVSVSIRAAEISEGAAIDLDKFAFSKSIRASDFRTQLEILGEFCRAEGVSHIHCHSPFVAVFGACLAHTLRIPYFLTVHGSFDAQRKINPTIGYLISHVGFAAASKVFSVSDAVATQVQKEHKISRDRNLVVMNSVANWDEKKAASARKGRWAFVSRLEEKQVDALSHIIRLLPSLPISELHILGDGSHYDRAVEIAKRSSNVHFHGAVEDVPARLPDYEGVACYGGRAFLEAVAGNCHCIICHENGIVTIVTPESIAELKAENYTGRGQLTLTEEQLLVDWERKVVDENIQNCKELLRVHHDSEKIWTDYCRVDLSDSSHRDVPMVSLFLNTVESLVDHNKMFVQPDFLFGLRNRMINNSLPSSEFDDVVIEVASGQIKKLRRELKSARHR